ncbi:nuclear receptor coactivator 4-like [Lineus longissimus]|uniref:nuclear receptor coactivator 4-like n=1 Tax=Lineus longissimus TaxID=88925 RepID=UPI002B4F7EA5
MSSSWTSSNASPEYLFSLANHQISVLEESLEHIAHTKIQLRDHAQEVKSQIHGAISRQLETLRNREVWLLGQVEVIKQAKDDLLFQQQEEISRALGALKNALDCMESTMNSEDTNVEQVLVETLEKLKTLSLHPCEMPHITFKVNNPAMKSAIFKFGKVDSKGLPTEVAFADPHRPSTCLPSCFEEYGDAEHHVLYKTLESVNRERNNDHRIQVRIPKLLEGDWLYKPSASYPSPTQPVSSDGLRSSSSNPLASWLLKSDSSNLPKVNDASIQNWLHHIQEGEMEDDFEFVGANKTRTSSESESIVVVPMSVESCNAKPTFSYFQMVKSAPLTAWLLQPQANVHVNESSDGAVKSLASQLNYFREVSCKMEDWLPKKVAESDIDMTEGDENKMANSNADFCYTQCACRPDTVEIEDLEGISCIPSPGSKGSSSPDLKVWLKRDRKPEDDMESPSLAKVCRANELCSSVGECCCEPNCIDRSQPANPWLVTDKNSPYGSKRDLYSPEIEFARGVLDTWRKIQNTPMSDWLPMQCKESVSKEDKEKSEIDPVVKSMMGMSLCAPGYWLHEDSKGLDSCKLSASFGSCSTESTDLSHWLVKKVSCSSPVDGNKFDFSNWLKKPMASEDKCNSGIEKLLSSFENKVWLKKTGGNNFSEAKSVESAVIKSDLSEWVISNDMDI